MKEDGELTITAGGQSLSGWQEIEVIRGIEIMPSIFSLTMTDKTSEKSDKVIFKPGDPCSVSIGGDPVITGYVDRLIPSMSQERHSIQVLGRSKSQDAVDCSAEWKGGQIRGTLLQIATKLFAVYGISVEADEDTGPPIPQFNLTIGETAFAIVERIARYRGFLLFDLPNGNVKLARAGKDKMGSGFKQGENIQRAQAEYSMDGRFSVIEAFITATDTLKALGDGGNLLAEAKDPGVLRRRLRTVISEGGALGNDVAIKRAQWEVARRAGRSAQITVTADAWRDTGGKLWTPNAIVPVEAPALKLPPTTDWLVAQVAFRRNSRDGTTADVLCMPKDAFLPEPFLLQPLRGDIAAAFP